ncbi:ThiF family adenylyltransferase [Ralstonia pseudosolanacearum]
MMPTTLSLPSGLHEQLFNHLFPGDGLEAAGILLCSRVPGRRLRFLAREVLLVPYEACGRRTATRLTWPAQYIEQAIDRAHGEGLALFLVHSHPSGYPNFSPLDDDSDAQIMPSVFEAYGEYHGTAVMLPDGRMLARVYSAEQTILPIDLVSVASDDLHFWWRDLISMPSVRPLAFTSAMTSELSSLTACVIGASGTGSIVAEQACRLGFGDVILIDHDHVEEKNLNRILNTVRNDAVEKRSKVEVLAQRANLYRDTPYVKAIATNLLTREAVLSAAEADVVFCCVDSHRGRSVADRLAMAFLLPLFDVGVAIPTREVGDSRAIAEVVGRIDYVQPGKSTLFDRGVYTAASLQAEALAESDPVAHREQVKAGYIDGIPEQAPAVISLNMRAASACVMEFIARAYPFRHEPNARYARTQFMLAEGVEEHTSESEFPSRTMPDLARGEKEPLLGLPILKAPKEKA